MNGAKYWDHAWNPVIGCVKISEGCEHCWAERMAYQKRMVVAFSTPTATRKNPPKSGVVFVGNMTDLFGEWNTDREIYNWLAELSSNAINLILTKRAERYDSLDLGFHLDKWFGVTAENQKRLEERYFHLWRSGVEKRWLSLEPLLGPIDLRNVEEYTPHPYGIREHDLWLNRDLMKGIAYHQCGGWEDTDLIPSWVVVGSESGPQRRPCNVEWVRSIVWQCQAAGVPVFVKQLDLDGKLVTDITKFPEDLQVRETPWGK